MTGQILAILICGSIVGVGVLGFCAVTFWALRTPWWVDKDGNLYKKDKR